MGKQVKQIPQNLKEIQDFLQNEIGDELDKYNLKFSSNESFFNGMIKNVEEIHQSSSIYVDDETYYSYLKMLNKAKREELYFRELLLDSVALIVGDAKHPSFLINNGQYTLPANSKWESILNQQTLRTSLKSIGRIEYVNRVTGAKGWLGTGWLYQNQKYLITNTHVANIFSQMGANQGEFVFRKNLSMFVDFLEEYESQQEWVFKIDKVCYKGDLRKGDLDIAILKIQQETDTTLPKGLELDTSLNVQVDRDVVVVGYPSNKGDSRAYTFSYDNWLEDIFCNARMCVSKYLGVKRISPGKIIRSEEQYLLHNCSTLIGNSGSPLMDAKTGKVLAIHFEGDPSGYNYNRAIKAEEIQKIMFNNNLL